MVFLFLAETSTKNFSFWENFGSTPSKTGKAMKHHSDSSAFDDGDEKVNLNSILIEKEKDEI